MQNTSTVYKELYSLPHIKEAKLEIYDTTGVQLIGTFTDEKLISMSTERSLVDEDTLRVGCCASGEIDVEFIPTDNNGNRIAIPRMAMLKPYYRLHSVDSNNTSEYIQKGVYFIDTREENKANGALKVHGFDALIKSEANYPSDTASEYPKQDTAIVTFLANALGVTVDSRTWNVITGLYSIGLPLGYSIREVLGGIAAMYCANFCISDTGSLLAIGVDSLQTSNTVFNLVDTVSGASLTFGGDRISV